LADNSTIVLDNAQKGNLTQQGKTRILKLDNGQLAYNTSGEAKEVLYNTITTPRGGKYQVTLSDGSQVWLNAASSIKFPVAFIGNERKVEITGEAYFEVAKDPSKRFIVDANGITTEVLGTHFNINSYANEGSTKVTLIEGSVKVESGNGRESVVIKPGQQAQIADKISVENNVDIEQVLAWKNGQFVLKGTDVAALMRQVERWYDVDVIFAGKIPERKFGGSVSQTVNLSVVLQALKEYNVMCRVEGKKVIVD
jgi:ferric-dicitrate binding protein FerR (iron transport regulator)